MEFQNLKVGFTTGSNRPTSDDGCLLIREEKSAVERAVTKLIFLSEEADRPTE